MRVYFLDVRSSTQLVCVKESTLAGNVDFLKILTNADFSFVKLRIDVVQNLPGNLDLLFYDVVC